MNPTNVYHTEEKRITHYQSITNGVHQMPNRNKGLAAGDLAPDFRLQPAVGDGMVGLADFRGPWVGLLFFRGGG